MLELNNILNKITEMLQTLSEILQTEQKILIENSLTSQLSEIINKKSQLLIQLKLLDDNRIKLSKKFNVQPPYKENPTIAAHWLSITDTTKLLSKINRDNGLIIQNRMNITQQSINYLKGINNPTVYTNNGYQQTDVISSKRAKV
ncbi:flagella synthesis protein FlgN [Gilliamella bombicola]|uniref:Flagella synthesis protein FlgN n=1 Tax=Gilliamella bombicola TaxID=1798182 RepID=A0A1C4BCE9_9GAMM|nr:flagellar protein FlgN [Gilliamella bombicola]SCC04529.1 flagella synthesis protein FlgN [Gilliamella bombicola]